MVRGDGGIERVAAHERLSRRVRADTVEHHLELAAAEERVQRDVVAERVQHDHRVDVVEYSRAGEDFLAATAFFGRCADQAHPPAEAFGDLCGAEETARGRRADDVVPARVPEPGKRVVFGKHGDVGAVFSGRTHEECGV